VLKKLFRFTLLVVLAATVVWLTRERLLPTPRVPRDQPPPHYRSTPPAAPSEPDDLTAIKGIGPVYAARLNDAGVRTFRELSETNAGTIADTVGTTEAAVSDWIAQAKTRLG
jgi:predicted flap endonuclease-1-like 5' DNA nuclease